LSNTVLTELRRAAIEAVRLKRDTMEDRIRKDVSRIIHVKQFEDTEKDVTAVVEREIKAQVSCLTEGLMELGSNLSESKGLARGNGEEGEEGSVATKSIEEEAKAWATLAFSPGEWTDRLKDRLLPVLAGKMMEAAVAQMVSVGVDPRDKAVQGLTEKFNPYHDSATGRFVSNPGGGPMMAPDTGGGFGGGGSSSGVGTGMSKTKRDKDGKLTMADGAPLPKHIPKNIPPAWRNVVVARNPKAELLVKGRDAKGRWQSVYSKQHWEKAAKAKFAKTNELRKKARSIKAEVNKDAKNPVTREEASCLRLIINTGMRPGGRGDTKAEMKAYGASTIEGRHVRVSTAGKVTLVYIGKKGVSRKVEVTDKTIKADLIRRKKAAGARGKIFNTNEVKLSKYSQTKDGGKFKTKDFRTAKGTTAAVDLIKQMPRPKNEKEYKKAVKEVGKKVSEVLGNTPAVALQSYIDPAVFSVWR